MADKADWRNCQLSKDEEIEMAEKLKSQFKEYDPNSWFLQIKVKTYQNVDFLLFLFTFKNVP